jgi:hypothetical protein
MPQTYKPLLRSKSGEVSALENLAAPAKRRIFPIVHLVAKPPGSFANDLAAAWAGLPIAIDGLFNMNAVGSTASFTSAVTTLGQQNVPVVPSIECDAPANYVTAAKRFVGRFAAGVVVKATLRQLPHVSTWVAGQAWQLSDVHLVIIAGHAALYPADQFEAFVLQAIRSHIPNPGMWASVALASSAAPRDHGALASGRNVVPRLDWQLWNAVRPQLNFELEYGDYGIAFPDLTEPPGVAMTRATVSVRYAVDDDWIILKGNPTTGKRGQPMGTQYRAHARALLREPQFDNVPNCWADGRIRTLAATAPPQGAGNRESWVAIGVNRHLSLVAHHLP